MDEIEPTSNETISPNAPIMDTDAPNQDSRLESEQEHQEQLHRDLGGLTPAQFQNRKAWDKLQEWNENKSPDKIALPFNVIAHAGHWFANDPFVRAGAELSEQAGKSLYTALNWYRGHQGPDIIKDSIQGYIRDSTVAGISINHATGKGDTGVLWSDRVLNALNDITSPDKHKIISNNAAYNLEEWGLSVIPWVVTGADKAIGAIAQHATPIFEYNAWNFLKSLHVPEAAAGFLAEWGAKGAAAFGGMSIINSAVSDVHRAATGKPLEPLAQTFQNLAVQGLQGFALGTTGAGLVMSAPPLFKKGKDWIQKAADKTYETTASLINRVRNLRKGKKVPKMVSPKNEAAIDGLKHQVITRKDAAEVLAQSSTVQTSADLPSAAAFYRARASQNIEKINAKDGQNIQRYLGITEEKITQDRLSRASVLEELSTLSEHEIHEIPSYHLAKIRQIIKEFYTFKHEYTGVNWERMFKLDRIIKKQMPTIGIYRRLQRNLGFDRRSLPLKESMQLTEDIKTLSSHESEAKLLRERTTQELLEYRRTGKLPRESKLEGNKGTALYRVKGEHGPTLLARRLHELDDEINQFKGIKNDLITVIGNKPGILNEHDKLSFVADTHNLPPSNPKFTPEEKIEAETSLESLKESGGETGLEKQKLEQIDETNLQDLTPEEKELAQNKIKNFYKLSKKERHIREDGKKIFQCLTRID